MMVAGSRFNLLTCQPQHGMSPSWPTAVAARNGQFAKNRETDVTDSPSHLALRELRADFTNPKGLLALAGVGVLLGLSGPFQTYGLLGVLPRLTYWIAMVFTTYAAGGLIITYAHYRWGARLGEGMIRIIVLGLAASCGVMIVVSILNKITFGHIHDTPSDIAVTFAFTTAISVIIVGLLTLLSPYPDANAPDARSAKDQPPAIMARLPLEKRGALVSLSVEDHYVHVTTTKGDVMLLMRLSDAINETPPTVGLQVHRSHWVATTQVARTERIGDRAILTLHNGTQIPASRSYMAALRAAGLLPKPASVKSAVSKRADAKPTNG